jgi:hypothetical protein
MWNSRPQTKAETQNKLRHLVQTVAEVLICSHLSRNCSTSPILSWFTKGTTILPLASLNRSGNISLSVSCLVHSNTKWCSSSTLFRLRLLHSLLSLGFLPDWDLSIQDWSNNNLRTCLKLGDGQGSRVAQARKSEKVESGKSDEIAGSWFSKADLLFPHIFWDLWYWLGSGMGSRVTHGILEEVLSQHAFLWRMLTYTFMYIHTCNVQNQESGKREKR